jgi:gamma-glutamyltranspeptidase/glutathione hydrolase
MILGLFERLGVTEGEGFAHLHGLIEATKRAFRVRDRVITDPGRLPADPRDFLTAAALDRRAASVDMQVALPWPQPAAPGDTVWMGAIDRAGRAVSYIQSIYWEFGSGVVLRDTGITWQNRGISFTLDPTALNALEPGRKPFHTLNPALARFDDGRVMLYGTMGGEGQPQTQAAVFTRYARFGQPLQQAVSAPRWLLGRTWGDASTSLKLENRFAPALVEALRAAGHQVELLAEPFSDIMGHAGALVRHADGLIEGAADPRSDGAVAAL